MNWRIGGKPKHETHRLENSPETEALYQAILDTISDAVFLTDDDGNLVFVCVNAKTIFGYSAVEIQSMGNLSELLGEGVYRHRLLDPQEELSNIEWGITDMSGRQHLLLVNIKRVSIGKGTVLYTCRDVTDRVGAERALQNREAVYRAILDMIPDGLTQMEEGRVTFISDRACEIFGRDREKFSVLDEMDLVAPEDRERVKNILMKTSRAGDKLQELEFWIAQPDGERRFIRNRYTSLRDAEGRERSLVLTTDITDRKRTETALVESEADLRESEARYRALFDDVPVGLYRSTPEGQILDANRALVEMLGYPDRQTLLETNAVDIFVNPEDRQHELDLLDRSGGLLNYVELMLRRYDGEIIWVRDTMRTVRHHPGALLSYDGSLEDITERKAAERARSLLASIVESSNEAIIGMDLEGVIMSWNSGAERIYGYPQVEVIGLPVTILGPSNRPDELPGLLEKVRQGQRVEQHETVRVRKDRQEIQVSLTLSPIIDKSGHIIGASKIARDITLQKRMEGYVLRAERLAAMGQVAASLAHEVKNPLQAIQSNLELVRDFPLEADEREICLLTCSREVEQLLDITQRMLSFSRSDRHTVHPVSIQQIWGQALRLMEKSLEKASVQIYVELPDDLPPVLAVADQIQQVLFNLLVNSIEAMPNGGDLLVRATLQGEMLVLTLVNDGPPIPAEHLDHIFDPFFTTKTEGTGLGLFISHNIIEQHGGRLSVENLKNGQGVAFSLSLPVMGLRNVQPLPGEKGQSE